METKELFLRVHQLTGKYPDLKIVEINELRLAAKCLVEKCTEMTSIKEKDAPERLNY